MQQSIVKFIAFSYRHCSTCFGHSYAYQEPVKLPVAVSGFRVIVEVEVFSAMVGLLALPTIKLTTAENTSTSTFIRKPEAVTAV